MTDLRAQAHPTIVSPKMPSHGRRILLPSRPRPSKHAARKKSGVRPERKASVRKEAYDVDDDEGDDDEKIHRESGADEESEPSNTLSANTQATLASDVESGTQDVLDKSDSDGEMAVKLQAAGDCESLLGSGESGDDQEDSEERFIIADTVNSKKRAVARAKGDPAFQKRRQQLLQQRGQSRIVSSSARGADHDDAIFGASMMDDLGSLSPDTMRLLGLPVLEDELFAEQAEFHSDSEPSFSDFFGSDDEDDAQGGRDDDDELTSLDSSDLDDTEDDADISDLEGALVGEPFLAHVGEVDAAPQTAEQLNAAMEAGAEIARQDIPLLVIEDLDGRLIYARAGDGEAVFGSDGEFEFVDDSDSNSDSVAENLNARDHRWAASAWAGANTSQRARDDERGEVFDDEGDTTDDLLDEDMQFPRLLVGSVDPRGGRTSRRARAMAARLRRLSPNEGSRAALRRVDYSRTESTSVVDDGATSAASEATPSTEANLPLGGAPSGSDTSAYPADRQSTSGSALSTITLRAAVPATPVTSGSEEPLRSETEASSRRQPEMGSFIPSSTNSVHRAVIDGSKPAASPFTSKYSLQRRGLAGKRRSRRCSTTPSKSIGKRARHDSPSGGLTQLDEFSEAPSSPEAIKTDAPLPMDLDDVVNASMLWRSDESSETGADDQDSDVASESTADPSKSHSRAATDSVGLNVNAFSRWRKIPMGVFRDQQQLGRPLSRHERIETPRASGLAGNASDLRQPVFGNFLLQRVTNGSQSDRRVDRSPFRRTGSHGGSLHMVVPSPHATSSDQRGESFVVSPVLWPARSGNAGRNSLGDAILNPLALASMTNADAFGSDIVAAPVSNKMTKREKRERKAARAALRAAARAEKQRLRNEEGTGSTASDLLVSAPTTPRVETRGGLSVGSENPRHLLSPTKVMPRLSITEASPRASPVPPAAPVGPSSLRKARSAGDGQHSPWTDEQSHQQSQPYGSGEHDPQNSSQLSGNTPPTCAVAGDGHVPILPSSTFGPPLVSPLFGGLFAPLSNVHGHNEAGDGDDEDLEASNEAPVLRI